MSVQEVPRRATVFKNGSSTDSSVVAISSTLEEFLIILRDLFACPELSVIFTAKGGRIIDTNVIKDDETLYVSNGEPFMPVPSKSFGGIESQETSEWIRLNVGGQLFQTSRTTLLNREPNSVLARMFDPDSNIQPSCVDSSGAYLIDRDPKYFAPLLNYLRTGNLIIDPDTSSRGVLEEAKFYDLQQCISFLQETVISEDEMPLTRRDVVNALISTANNTSLRFQGVNLSGSDLSYLDLRHINFKYAKLRNAKLSYCNLSFCNFERADMTGVEMNCAILSGVRMACATLESAHCCNCNFQDPSGNNANMEGVNLRNAVLEDSDLSGANLRVSNLKNANLKATILRGAILAGADLENCDLTGSDLHEANLRGANLKDASLELMINPLHMSQAIR